MHTKEPIFGMVLESFWLLYRRMIPYTNSPTFLFSLTQGTARSTGGDIEALQSDCFDWNNLSAFIARCIRSGLLDRFEKSCGYPLYDIPKGLQEYHPVETVQRCFVTVAVQYILLAGIKIYQELIEKPAQGS